MPFALFSHFALSYIVLDLSSAVTNLPNKISIFKDFQRPTIKFHDFPGLENAILRFHDSVPGFPITCTNPDVVSLKYGKIEQVKERLF